MDSASMPLGPGEKSITEMLELPQTKHYTFEHFRGKFTHKRKPNMLRNAHTIQFTHTNLTLPFSNAVLKPMIKIKTIQ